MAFHIVEKTCQYCNKNFNGYSISSIKHCSLFCRFWSKVEIKGSNECWEWQAAFTHYGYGQINVDGRPIGSHRLAFEFNNGMIFKNINVLHHCDNPPCCNPNHLFLGTQQINMQDMTDKGRRIIGSDCPFSKLSEKEVKIIKLKNKKGISGRKIAKEFNVSPSTIMKIINKETWKHLN